MINNNKLLVLVFATLIFSQGIFAQTEKEVLIVEEPKAKLLETIEKYSNSEVRSLLIDRLIGEVISTKNSKGVILIFCGKVCQYGEIEAHIKGVNHKLRLRGADTKDFLVLFGGYQDKQVTELWLIPENICPPLDRSERKIENVKFNGKFKKEIVYYECCNPDLKLK